MLGQHVEGDEEKIQRCERKTWMEGVHKGQNFSLGMSYI
jgi:hypothetical protein